MGSPWKIPNAQQIDELMNGTNHIWTIIITDPIYIYVSYGRFKNNSLPKYEGLSNKLLTMPFNINYTFLNIWKAAWLNSCAIISSCGRLGAYMIASVSVRIQTAAV